MAASKDFHEKRDKTNVVLSELSASESDVDDNSSALINILNEGDFNKGKSKQSTVTSASSNKVNTNRSSKSKRRATHLEKKSTAVDDDEHSSINAECVGRQNDIQYGTTSDTSEDDKERNEQNDDSDRRYSSIDRMSKDEQSDDDSNNHRRNRSDRHAGKERNKAKTKKDKCSKSTKDNSETHSKNRHEKSTTNTQKKYDKLPSDVPKTWKNAATSPIGKSERGYVMKIDLPNESIALKIFTLSNKTKTELEEVAQRATREKIALTKIKGLDNVPQIIESNIPDSVKQFPHDKKAIWIAVKFSFGCTLMSLIETLRIDNFYVPLIDSIRFCQKLLQTIKNIHAKGTIHRDIKPANIVVQCDQCKARRICSQCKAVLIDYGLAYNRTKTDDETSQKYQLAETEEVTLTNLEENIGNTWCRVPQMAKSSDAAVRLMTDLEKYERKQLRRSPTTDPSSVCAILFTLLTKQHPGSTRNEKGLQPHHRCAEQLSIVIKSSFTNPNLGTRIEAYLMDTFDKGFGYPDIQWTVEQLEYRLNLIAEMMERTSEENTIVYYQIPVKKTAKDNLIAQLRLSEILVRKLEFIQVANAFSAAKKEFC